MLNKYIKRSNANTAIKFPLDCEAGEDYHLLVISAFSDAFRLKRSHLMREAALMGSDGKLTAEAQLDMTGKLVASTIVGWNLPEEFGQYTPEGAENLLLDYPEISYDLDTFTSAKENFVEKKSKG